MVAFCFEVCRVINRATRIRVCACVCVRQCVCIRYNGRHVAEFAFGHGQLNICCYVLNMEFNFFGN